MNDEKKIKGDLNTKELNDSVLEGVSAGSSGYIIMNSSFYSSGDTPKYKCGDLVWIRLNLQMGLNNPRVLFFVTAVSSTRNGGDICKEFTYSVKAIERENVELHGVYESCMEAYK